jgi:hypothetical protein
VPPEPGKKPLTFASRARFAAANILLPLGLSWVLISSLQAHFFTGPPTWSRDFGSYGPMTLKLQLPGTHAGIEEPVLTVGRPGQATFVYIRLLSSARARVGIEFWGLTAYESPPFRIPSQDAQITVEASFPALFPKMGSADWGSVSNFEQKHILSEFIVSVDGVVRVRGPVNYDEPPRLPVYLGRNPLGGSLVSDFFTGKVLEAWHEY